MPSDLSKLVVLFTEGLPIHGDTTQHDPAGELAALVKALTEGTPLGKSPSAAQSTPAPAKAVTAKARTIVNAGCWSGEDGQAELARCKEIARKTFQAAMVKLAAEREAEEARQVALKQLLGEKDYERILPYIAKQGRRSVRR